MTLDNLEQLLKWRVRRGYRGLTLRSLDNSAWIASFGEGKSRSSKNFKFNPNSNIDVLWQLDEACKFLEKISAKTDKGFQMFGPERLSRTRHVMKHGNDLEGVLIESRGVGGYRLQICLRERDRIKLWMPQSLSNEISHSWMISFGRQIRALTYDSKNDDMSIDDIKDAWKEFTQGLKSNSGLYSAECFDINERGK